LGLCIRKTRNPRPNALADNDNAWRKAGRLSGSSRRGASVGD